VPDLHGGLHYDIAISNYKKVIELNTNNTIIYCNSMNAAGTSELGH